MDQNTAYIEIGGNQGDRANNIKQAINLLQKNGCTIVQQSSVYETPPWGFDADQNFYNMAIKVKTAKSAFKLMEMLMKIEKQLGRFRGTEGYASRTIDLDILFFNDEIINTQELVIPHERLHLRKFVLLPLIEIAPELNHPILNDSIKNLLKICADNSICTKIKCDLG